MPTKSQTKTNLRKKLREARRRLAAETGFDTRDKLPPSFLKFLPNIQLAVVAGYIPLGSEVDCTSLMRALEMRGIKLALPVVVKKNAPLEFRAYAYGDELKDGLEGNKEPGNEAAKIDPDIILVPLIGFDEKGNRVGQGKGYYDRTLEALRKKHNILAIGLAFEGLKQKSLPVEAHDQPLDAVLTEAGIWKFRGGKAKK